LLKKLGGDFMKRFSVLFLILVFISISYQNVSGGSNEKVSYNLSERILNEDVTYVTVDI
jgi:hypothetical protein